MTTPPLCTHSCAWTSHRGAIQAYSLVDGARLYRYKTRATMRLSSLGGDSVLAFLPHRKGAVLTFGSLPPGLLLRHRPRDPVTAADCQGSQAALLFPHGMTRLVNGTWTPQAFPRAAAPGWTNIEVVSTGSDTVTILSRRSGTTYIAWRDSLVAMAAEFRGGVVEAAAAGDSLLLVGGEGALALYDLARGTVWKSSLPSGLQFDPVIVGNRIWAACRDRRLVLTDVGGSTPSREWSLTGPLSCPLAAYGEGVAWGTFDGSVWMMVSPEVTPTRLTRLKRPAVGVASSGRLLVVAQEDGRLLGLRPLQ